MSYDSLQENVLYMYMCKCGQQNSNVKSAQRQPRPLNKTETYIVSELKRAVRGTCHRHSMARATDNNNVAPVDNYYQQVRCICSVCRARWLHTLATSTQRTHVKLLQ